MPREGSLRGWRDEQFDRVTNGRVIADPAQACTDLNHAAGIAGDDELCACLGERLGFALADFSGEFWLQQVVDASGAAAVLGARMGHKL